MTTKNLIKDNQVIAKYEYDDRNVLYLKVLLQEGEMHMEGTGILNMNQMEEMCTQMIEKKENRKFEMIGFLNV